MRAIDTNVVVRFLTADDAKQAQAARAAIEAGDIFVTTTVVLETEWVLRTAYGFAPDKIAAGLRSLLGLAAITLEDPPRVSLALDWMMQGMDFADALHVAGADHCTAFLSFDRKLGKRAKGVTPIPVEAP